MAANVTKQDLARLHIRALNNAEPNVIVKFGDLGQVGTRRELLAYASEFFKAKLGHVGKNVSTGEFVAKNPSKVNYEGKRDFDVTVGKDGDKIVVTIKGVSKIKVGKLFIKYCTFADDKSENWETNDIFELIELLRSFEVKKAIKYNFSIGFIQGTHFLVPFLADLSAFRSLVSRINDEDFFVLHQTLGSCLRSQLLEAGQEELDASRVLNEDVVVKFGDNGQANADHEYLARASEFLRDKLGHGDGSFVAWNMSAIDYEGKRDFDVDINTEGNKVVVTINGVSKINACKVFVKLCHVQKLEPDVIDGLQPEDVFELIELLRAFHVNSLAKDAFDTYFTGRGVPASRRFDRAALRRLETITHEDVHDDDFKQVHKFAYWVLNGDKQEFIRMAVNNSLVSFSHL